MAYARSRYEEESEEPSGPLAHVDWEVPERAKVPGYVLALGLAIAWAVQFFADIVAHWGLSGAALAQGRWEAIGLHMFAHSEPWHLLFNVYVLVAVSGPLVARLGPPIESWARYALLYFLCGLAGAALFLATHPTGSVPMVGASGAISGLCALLFRISAEGAPLEPLQWFRLRPRTIEFVKDNLPFALFLTLPVLLLERSDGVAWEAYLGGALVGLFVGPRLLPRGTIDGNAPVEQAS